jgi:hypothetical protein
MKTKVGIISFATGNYHIFARGFYRSCDEHFFARQKEFQVSYFLFTDDQALTVQTERQFHKILIPHLRWPGPTLKRYHFISKHAAQFKEMDYLFYSDIDMKFVDFCGPEILGSRVATQHPGYAGTEGTPERDSRSKAYIPEGSKSQYFCGGFNGGSRGEYLKMAKSCGQAIEEDFAKNIVAVWHDESHLNRYFFDHSPETILTPSYCFDPKQENLKGKYRPILYALHKTDRENLRHRKKMACLVFHKNALQKYGYGVIERFKSSILNQSFEDFKIFEINYGGDDHRIFSKTDGRETAFTSRSMGNHAEAMNLIMEQAMQEGFSAAFITNVDDFYSPFRFENQYGELLKGADVVSSNFFYVTTEGEKILITRNKDMISFGDIGRNFAEGHNVIANPCVAIRIDAWSEFPYIPAEIPEEDFLAYKRMLTAGKRFVIHNEWFLYYRLSSEQVSAANNPAHTRSLIRESKQLDYAERFKYDYFTRKSFLESSKKSYRRNPRGYFLRTLGGIRNLLNKAKPGRIPIRLLSFADEKFANAQTRLEKNRVKFGYADSHFMAGPDDLRASDLFTANPQFNSSQKGFGYWLWKPFLMLRALQQLPPGGALLYLDADDGLEVDCREVLLALHSRHDVILNLTNSAPAIERTKRDAFVAMHRDTPFYHEQPQIEAGFISVKNTPRGCAFLEEWFSWCRQFSLISDEPSRLAPEHDEFCFHRHDQALLNLLSFEPGVSRSRELSGYIKQNLTWTASSH